MRKGLYTKLALINIKNHRRLFVPFMLSCAGCLALFDIMLTLMYNSRNIMAVRGASTVGFVLQLGCVVVGFFSVFLVFYANSFIIKRRKREFGLYNVLGMEKRHIARVMAVESVITSALSLVAGIAFACVFARLLALILYKMLNVPTLMNFELSPAAALYTAALFACVFFATYLWNVSRVGFSSGIELLKGGEVGEREPKTKHIITVLGILTLGGGYYLALTTKEPAMAILLFFVAVILVIIGTYCLFTSGSIALLKTLKKNKRYYYDPKHFTSVSGMIYRMKQNAAGLANICILSTMVLVMLSSTISLYSSLDDTIRRQFPRDVSLSVGMLNDENYQETNDFVNSALERYKGEYKNRVAYRYINRELVRTESGFAPMDESADIIGYTSRFDMFFIPLGDYLSLIGDSDARFLDKDQALVYCPSKPFEEDEMRFGDVRYKASAIDSFNVDEYYAPAGASVMYVIVPTSGDLEKIALALGTEYMGYGLRNAFDVECPDDEAIAMSDALNKTIGAYLADNASRYQDHYVISSCAAGVRDEYLGIYSGLLFLGIFLGLMFTMAAALIMYYRQISEGYDDSRRYEIMRNVGMSLKEVAASIKSQVLTVFFLPLAAAGIHIAMAFPMIATMFKLLRLTNVALFAQSTLICLVVFALIYLAVYALTARTYYKIVSRPAL